MALDEVVAERCTRIAPRRPVLLPSIDPLDAGTSHQALDALSPDVDAFAKRQLGMHTRGAVGAAAHGVDLGDPLGQQLVRRRPR